MAKVVIIEDGTKIYLNENGKTHREDGPAIIKPDGTFQYCYNGKIGGDYNMYYDGTTGEYTFCEWLSKFNCAFAEREDGPAYTTPNGYKGWDSKEGGGWPILK